jgi:MFS family permease
MALFMPSLISGMGYTTIQTQLLTVPPYFVASIVSILVAWLSQRYSKRGIWILMMLPLAMIGSGMLIGSNNRNVEYAGIFFLASGSKYIITLVRAR